MEKQQPLRGRNVKGFESLKKRLQEFEKTSRTGFGEIARVLGYLRRMPYSWLAILPLISRYFSRNPDEGSILIRKGFVASAIFMLYTHKTNLIFSDIQNRNSRLPGRRT